MMNSIKRIISIILALTMVLSMFVLVQADETGATTQAVKYEKEIAVISALGIINGDETGTFNADANLTRAEFAQVLTVLLKINEGEVAKEKAWYYKFEIPKDLDNVLLTPNSGLVVGNETPAAPAEIKKIQKFTDVETTHWAYDVIAKITDIGYMVGASDTEFRPEEPVTVNQVNKVLVKLLGYEAFAMKNGGYPAGYNYIASTLKMLKGINNYGENPVTRGELAKIIYNMFDVNTIAVAHITDSGVATYETSKEKFLNDVLGVYKYEGKVTDNGTTAIYGSSTVDKNEIKIGNVVFKLSEEVDHVKSYIGRVVEFYTVKDEKSNKEMVIYAALEKDSEEFVVDIKDFHNLSNGKLEYFDEDEKKQYIDVDTMPVIILNGSKVEDITKEEIKTFTKGTVSAYKSSTSNRFDTIVIDGSVSVFVEKVIPTEKLISNGLVDGGTTSAFASIDLKEENNKDRLITILKNGKKASFEDISVNSVLDVTAGEKMIKIIITDKTASFTVAGKSEDELGEIYLYDAEGNAYRVSADLAKSTEIKVPEVGVEVTAYFNSYDEIVAVDTSVEVLSELGLIVSVASEGQGEINKAYKVRIFTQAGAFVVYELADKVAFTNDFDVYERITAAKAIKKLEKYKNMLATFTLTEDGRISEIIMPTNIELQDERANGRLGVFYKSEGTVKYYTGAFEGQAFTTKNAPKIFYVSSASDVEERARYVIKSSAGLSNDTDAEGVVGYNTNPKSVQADYFVVNSNKYITHRTGDRTTEFFVVESAKRVLGINGEPATRVSGYTLGAQNGAQTAGEFESSTGAFEKMISYVGNTRNNDTYSVEPGDIINIFEVNGNVEFASLIFRPTANYAENKRYVGGALVGQENGLSDPSGKGNPYAVSHANGVKLDVNGFEIAANETKNALADKPSAGFRVFDGFIVRLQDGVFTMTNQDLSNPGTTFERDGYVINSYAQPTNVTVVNVKGDKVTVNIGSVADIKTYDDFGYKCSRVIVNAYTGSLYKFIIINIED